jgi:NAD(P)-dependent dehydrogenase (short-subunit alcohol dehydrogenase family)
MSSSARLSLEGKSVLVTGANRGIGAALVRAFLKQGAGKVYAAARISSSLPDFGDKRIVPVRLDITKAAQINAAADQIGALDVLVNNAGVMHYNGILTATDADLAADMDVNYYATVRMMQAFAPLIDKRGGGVIVNVASVVSLAPVPVMSGYSASKAALFSATLAARAALKAKNIKVIGVYPGPIDTDLAKDLPLSKAPVGDTANEIVAGLIAGAEDIYPDPTAKQVSSLWSGNPKGLEQYFATLGAA